MLIWIGAAIALLVAADVFFTVFHPEGHGGPVNRLVTRPGWEILAFLGRWIRGKTRDRVLSVGGPLLALATLSVWGLGLVGGFALMYARHMDAFVHLGPSSGSVWIEAVYFSAYTLTTLGNGDLIPGEGWLRLLAVAEAFSGVIILSVGVAYVLSLYTKRGHGAALATSISTMFDGGDPQQIERLAEHPAGIDAWAAETARGYGDMINAYAQYPVLHYFRPIDPRASVLLQTGVLLRYFEALSESQGADGRPSQRWAELPGLGALRRGVDRYLDQLARFTHVRRVADMQPEDVAGLWSDRYARILTHLCYEERASDPASVPAEDSVDAEG